MSSGGDMLGFQMVFDAGRLPEKAVFEVAREPMFRSTRTPARRDQRRRYPPHPRARLHDTPHIYVHAATLTADSYQRIAASGGSASVSTESEQSAGQGYPPTWQLRRYDIPVSLSMDTSVWWSGDLFSAMRTTLSADRSREHLEAHARQETVTHHALRAQHGVEWATRGGSKALGMDGIVGSLEPGKKADVVLLKNDQSPAMTPIINPYGHVVYQAQRGDVHTVVINGRLAKHDHKLIDVNLAAARAGVERTVEYLVSQMGEEKWRQGMNPEIPEKKILHNPYQYTADWQSESPPSVAEV
jgi:cytosine/adenosine deaminase-related metal-dependent hydrolase